MSVTRRLMGSRKTDASSGCATCCKTWTSTTRMAMMTAIQDSRLAASSSSFGESRPALESHVPPDGIARPGLSRVVSEAALSVAGRLAAPAVLMETPMIQGRILAFDIILEVGVLMFSASLEIVLTIAYREAVSRRHAYLTLEHLLYALAHDPEGERILKGCGAELPR